MSVRFDGRIFEVSDGLNTFLPSAAEIYSVVFAEARSLRGVPVSSDEFEASGIKFSEYVADPVISLESRIGPEGTGVRCVFRAKRGSIEVEVGGNETGPCDYAVGNGLWMPLPQDASAEARQILANAGVKTFGQITLAQYMKLCRSTGSGVTIEDRTANTLAAGSLAPSLTGQVPAGLNGKLYGYQLDGFRWLSFMVQNGLGAIIADEMGLGKTVQVICLLLQEKARSTSPNLVIATTTLLENWRREIARFAPSLRVLVHSGPRRTGYPADLLKHDVLVCSFDTAVADISLLRNVRWNLVIADEAQNIKNPDAKRTIQLKRIPRSCAIAVTGTPVENQLQDLWSITDFVLPSLLGTLGEFERRHPDTTSGAALLEPVISPVLLRRTVAEVAGDLPERIYISQPLQLDADCVQAYEEIRAEALASHPKGGALAALQNLRMFCTHPWLTNQFQDIRDPADCSPKLKRLFEIMEEIVSCEGKALIFTSYSESLDLIQAEIAQRFQIPSHIIDGRVAIPERQRIVDAFSAHQSSAVLVLNPKAAGVGLNITAANHVIHFNLEWNPAVEDQASARAHRRGQTRPVTIHRLFYSGTVEEVIDERMQRKRELADTAIVGTDGQENDVDDILRALKMSPASSR